MAGKNQDLCKNAAGWCAITGLLVVLTFLGGASVINGTSGDDIIVDTPRNDVIRGLAGDDQITVTRGNDRIDSGDDDDQITITTPGRAYIVGGAGNDVIDAFWGATHRIAGGDGEDNVIVGASVAGSRIEAGDGDDVIDLTGTAGDNAVYGGEGDDQIEALGGIGNNTIYAGSGQDNITLGIGSSFVEGGEDTDTIIAGTDDISRDIVSIRVGDVPTGETEQITCTVALGARTTIILKRSSLGSFPRGTQTQFGASGILTIEDPRTGGIYEVLRGDGDCRVVRR